MKGEHNLCLILLLATLILVPDCVLAQDGPVSKKCKRYSYTRYVQVENMAELRNATAAAIAGDLIELLPGTYYLSDTPITDLEEALEDPARGRDGGDSGGGGGNTDVFPVTTNGLVYNKHGTPENMITICGPNSAIIDGSDIKKYESAAFRVVSSSYIRVVGMTMQMALKGVELQNSTYCEVARVKTRYTLQEGIRLRYLSRFNKVFSNTITYTGLLDPGVGEGIYIGSGEGATVAQGFPPDKSDYNIFYRNKCTEGVLAECIDVKEFTSYGKIYLNYFNGKDLQGVNGARSWVAVKGNRWKLYNNTGINTIKDGFGFKTWRQASGWGSSNTFYYNRCMDLPDSAYCIYLSEDTSKNQVECNNVLEGDGSLCNCKASDCTAPKVNVYSGTVQYSDPAAERAAREPTTYKYRWD